MTGSVRLEFDGIVRWYACESYFDAVVLKEALLLKYPNVQIWQGGKRIDV